MLLVSALLRFSQTATRLFEGTMQKGAAPQPVMGQPIQQMQQFVQQHAPQAFMAPPPGMGFTTKRTPEDECAPCVDHPGVCVCGREQPVYYAPVDRAYMGPRTEVKYNCCLNDFVVPNAQLLGTTAQFNWHRDHCSCDSRMQITDNGRPVGHVNYNFPCCVCSDFVSMEAVDVAGRSRFIRKIPACGLGYYFMDFSCCGQSEIGIPIYTAGLEQYGPSGNMNYRGCLCCPQCYSQWIGYRAWPNGAQSRDDHLLLMGMAHLMFHEIQMSRQRNNNQHHGGGMH